MKKTKYINPYLGGVLLGLVLLAANFISGRGLGASGAFKSVVVQTVNTITPQHAENTAFYSNYNETHPDGPMKSWLVFQILGVVVGGFLSGALSALAGLILIARLDSAQPTAGLAFEFDAIAAVVVGGTSFAGGQGGLIGTLIGVLIIAVLDNGLNLLNVSSFYQPVVSGVVIAVALLLHRLIR